MNELCRQITNQSRFMKAVYLSLVIVVSLFASCKKTATNPAGTGGNNGNGGGNGGGGNSALSVTSFSPMHPYTLDLITITGTGFNTDKTKDTVFVSGDVGLTQAIVQSATATQLTVLLPPDSVMGFGKEYYPAYIFDIYANGKHVNIGLDKAPVFKDALQIFFMRGQQNDGTIRPGDTLLIEGTGLSASGNALSIGGKSIDIFRVDTPSRNGNQLDDLSTCYAYAVFPKNYFGDINDETIRQNETVAISNADGKSLQFPDSMWKSPAMKVNSLSFETTFTPGTGYVYSLSSLNNTGGKIKLHINGKYLKDNTDLELVGFDAGNNIKSDVHSSLGVSGFPDSAVVEYGTAGLQSGLNYIVKIWANNVGANFYYGSETFLLQQ
jgi:hypothetical protein